MPSTIKDVAKKVGVNPSTVSRVINGTAKISEETRSKIQAAMQELDYHPNVAARSLVNGNTFTIALVIDAGDEDAFANAFFIQSVSAIERVSQEKGYNLLITNDANSKGNNTVKSLILEHKIDGMILPVSVMNKELISLLKESKLPFVILGEPENKEEGIVFVDIDNEMGGSLAVEHLYKAGYKRPALLVAKKEEMFEKQRILGYKKAIHKEDDQWILEVGSDAKKPIAGLEGIFQNEERPDCLICTNNVVAFNVLKELKKRRIQVPQEIGLMTFDNYPLAQFLEPALSVVDVDTYKMGEEAAKILFKMIKRANLSFDNYRIPTKIIARDSTKK